MKKYLLIVLLLGLPTFMQGQDKLLTIDDAVIGVNYHMYPATINQLKWLSDNDHYTYVKYDAIVKANALSEDEEIVFTLEDLNKVLVKNSIEELEYFPRFSWYNSSCIQFYIEEKLLCIDIEKKDIDFSILVINSANEKYFHKKSKALAYTVDNNFFINNSQNKMARVTNDTNPGIVNGSSYVHRSEFGIENGIFWSPNGKYAAFYRKDETMVSDYPLVEIDKRIAELRTIKYPMAGMKSEEVTLGIYNYDRNKTIFINTGEPKEQYLTAITWDPSEKYIYIGILNREQNHLKLNKYDISSGELVKTLFEEQHLKYVEPENPLFFFPNKPDEFLWMSERDGYNHIYHYNTDGKLLKQISKGDWVVTELHGINPEGRYIYYTSTAESPIERHVYQYDTKTNKEKKLTKKSGTHTATFNESFTYFIDEYSSTETPRTYYAINTKAKIVKTILEAENPLEEYKTGEMNIFTVKGGDGKTDLYCRMIKPIDFDPSKKYPAIVYVYGGPHDQMVSNTYLGDSRLWQYYMAQKGYVMLSLDNRGTDYRGFEFENVIHRNLGVAEVEDQMKGVEYLIKTGFVDSTRIGLHGWSYGGFMTLSMMEKYPDKFKVGVAGGPVTDWKYYEVMYGERYMDTPEENPEGYKNASVIENVDKLKDKKVLIVNGGIDNTVVWQNSLELLRESVEKEVLLDYFVYPVHEHNVRGKDRVHLMRKVTQYFEDFL